MLMVIVKKELKRVFSDRRLVFSAFVLPALSIFILYSLMGQMIGSMSTDLEEHIPRVAVVNGSEGFRQYLAEADMTIDPTYYLDESGDGTVERLKADVKSKAIDVLLVFDMDFDKKVLDYNGGGNPNVDTFYNPSEEYSQNARSKIEYGLLNDYKTHLLAERFGGISNLTVFTVNADNEDNKLAEAGTEAGLGMSFMLPMLMNIMLFAGAMGIGMDVIAGEKERGTMLPCCWRRSTGKS